MSALNNRKIRWLIVSLLLTLGVIAGYWWYETYYPSTDDAYVKANVIEIATVVSGRIDSTEVENMQKVQAGQILFTLDKKPFEFAERAAQAALEQTQQTVSSQQDAIKVADARVSVAKADQKFAEKNFQRIQSLVQKGRASRQIGDEAQKTLSAANANLLAAKEELNRANKQLGAAIANVKSALAKLDQATYDLAHSSIRAPQAGQVVNFQLRSGSYVNKGQPLFALIESNNWWIDANFKETQLKRLQLQQPVAVHIDMLPGKTLHGKVIAISRGSGSQFSLLPPENAAGNWIKITQRFPVRIALDPSPIARQLRMGASTTVTVNTLAKSTPSS